MSITMSWILDLVGKILGPVLDLITPMLREELVKFALKFYEKSLATENPWDDFLGKALLQILGISVPA